MDKFTGKVWVLGDDIDTDIIIPTEYLALKTIDDMKQYGFSPLRPELAAQIKPGDIIVAGKNFGCGSSREQAPEIIKALGIQCVIAKSFARIFFRNSINNGLLSINAVNIRDYAFNKHNSVDDYPYGGGAGMVMQAQPVYDAYTALVEKLGRKPWVIYMTPQGRTFNQGIAQELSEKEDIVLLCGHYEGIDERVLEMIVDDYMSIGDFVLTGGELPAMAIVDAVSRLVPGVLNNEDSAEIETFYNNLLEYPQYTRPPEFMGKKVPDVLLSGNHKLINEWRLEQSISRTKEHRPDMYEKYMIENPPKEKKKRRK